MTSPLWEDCKWLDESIHGLYENGTVKRHHNDSISSPRTSILSPSDPLQETVSNDSYPFTEQQEQQCMASSSTAAAAADAMSTTTTTTFIPVFPANVTINKKMYIYYGDCCKLPGDVLIIGQSQSLSDRSEYNVNIFNLAGPTLEEEILITYSNDFPITVGCSLGTGAGNLPYTAIIHSIGPTYHVKNKIPADYALHSAYRSALTMACTEYHAKTIIITTIYLKSKKYPRFEAAHVALRTIRKFLEHSIAKDIERVCLSVANQDDFETYSTLMTAYFPRSVSEEESQSNLLSLEDLGNEWGEVIVKERQNSIGPGPLPVTRRSISSDKNTSRPGDSVLEPDWPLPKSMMEVTENHDYERKLKVQQEMDSMPRNEFLKLKFNRMMDEAIKDNYDDIQAINQFLSFAGKDRIGATIIIFCPIFLRDTSIDHDKILRYVLMLTESIRCIPYSVIYANSGLYDYHDISYPLINDIFDIFMTRHSENLQQVYLLHASFWDRMLLLATLPSMTHIFWRGYIQVAGLKKLNAYAEVSMLTLPSIIKDADKKLNAEDYAMAGILY